MKEALTAPFLWLHYEQASILLEANGQFPNFAQLQQLQRKYRLDINISQIARNINDFFRDNTRDLENHMKLLEYAIEPEIGSISIKPEQFITDYPEYIHDDLHLLLADCCACKHLDLPFGKELHIASLTLPNSSREIVVTVVIFDALPDFTRPADNKIAQQIPLLITPDDLQPLIDIIDLWARGEDGIMYAINQQHRRNWPSTTVNLSPFRLGPRFIESVNERGLDSNEVILRSIIRAASDVILDRARDIQGYRLHPFRKSETADSPQFTRDSDGAKGWRLMLQKHGAGWRLHYWQIPTAQGSMIEFANVGKESEREIY